MDPILTPCDTPVEIANTFDVMPFISTYCDLYIILCVQLFIAFQEVRFQSDMH